MYNYDLTCHAVSEWINKINMQKIDYPISDF